MKRITALVVVAAATAGLSAGVAASHAGAAGAARLYHQESSIRAVHTTHGYTVVQQSK